MKEPEETEKKLTPEEKARAERDLKIIKFTAFILVIAPIVAWWFFGR